MEKLPLKSKYRIRTDKDCSCQCTGANVVQNKRELFLIRFWKLSQGEHIPWVSNATSENRQRFGIVAAFVQGKVDVIHGRSVTPVI